MPSLQPQSLELFDLLQFREQLLDREIGPGRLRLLVYILQQGHTEQALEGVDANLAIGPVIHGIPTQPVSMLHVRSVVDSAVAGGRRNRSQTANVNDRHEFGQERGGQPAPNLALDLIVFPARLGFIQFLSQSCGMRMRSARLNIAYFCGLTQSWSGTSQHFVTNARI